MHWYSPELSKGLCSSSTAAVIRRKVNKKVWADGDEAHFFPIIPFSTGLWKCLSGNNERQTSTFSPKFHNTLFLQCVGGKAWNAAMQVSAFWQGTSFHGLGTNRQIISSLVTHAVFFLHPSLPFYTWAVAKWRGFPPILFVCI